MEKNYYITTTLPYVNAKPHIGFALEIIQADALARYHVLLGDHVFFNTGTDEHGLKIYRNALEAGKNPQAYADEYAAKFRDLKAGLGLWDGLHFIRTTDEGHKKAAQYFWELCMKKGDIEKKKYQVSYCVGCELEKTDSELVDDRCPVHPNLNLELIDEENYFFLFSKYQKKLLDFYAARPDFVVPDYRFNEIKNFVESGLKDFSISRLKAKMPWGVEVPGDPDQVMYVWFDALINYISTLGWPDTSGDFSLFWPGVQVAGKDNLRQQSAMWQAMLMSAGVEHSKQIFIHGFITSEGQKMSKSLGNVVDPLEIAETYGLEALRYYLLGAVPAHDDGDFSTQRFEKFYTAHMVNGVGNLTSRILTMIEKYSESKIPHKADDCFGLAQFWKEYDKSMNLYQFDKVIELLNDLVSACDEKISLEKPWKKAKAGGDIQAFLYQLVETLRHIALALLPIIPLTAGKILLQLGLDVNTSVSLEEEQKWGRFLPGSPIRKGEILFGRLSSA